MNPGIRADTGAQAVSIGTRGDYRPGDIGWPRQPWLTYLLLMTELPEVPETSSETATLIAFLDYHRAVARRKAEGLTDAQLNQTVAASTLTIGGILKHLAFVEDWWWVAVWQGAPLPEPWTEERFAADEDWDFHSAADDSAGEILGLYDEKVAAAQAAVQSLLLAPHALEAVASRRRKNGEATSLRWILVHLIEEYARHCGHLDILREAIDGRTGD
jgi:uncharacterized damage-inducible protein DinB